MSEIQYNQINDLRTALSAQGFDFLFRWVKRENGEHYLVKTLFEIDDLEAALEIEYIRSQYDLWLRTYDKTKVGTDDHLAFESKVSSSTWRSVMVCSVGSVLELGTMDLVKKMQEAQVPTPDDLPAPPTVYAMRFKYDGARSPKVLTYSLPVNEGDDLMISFGLDPSEEGKTLAGVMLEHDKIHFGDFNEDGEWVRHSTIDISGHLKV